MWVVTVIAVSCVLVGPSLAGVKDLASHFSFYDQSPTPNTEPDPRGLGRGGALDMEKSSWGRLARNVSTPVEGPTEHVGSSASDH